MMQRATTISSEELVAYGELMIEAERQKVETLLKRAVDSPNVNL
jgi:hypothetical protein